MPLFLKRQRCHVSPGVGPTSASYACIPTGMHGPTCIFWTNLTPFSLVGQHRGERRDQRAHRARGHTEVGLRGQGEQGAVSAQKLGQLTPAFSSCSCARCELACAFLCNLHLASCATTAHKLGRLQPFIAVHVVPREPEWADCRLLGRPNTLLARSCAS